MLIEDSLRFSLLALSGYRLRTGLMLLAMTFAIAAILLLTALGEGARRYVIDEFVSLGTHLLIVLPGRSETTGGAPPLVGETPRDLTIGDMQALQRSRNIRRTVPLAFGQAPVAWQGRERDIDILGTTADFLPLRNMAMAKGKFLPGIDPEVDSAVCVLGQTVARELFVNQSPLGQWVRVGERRFRVTGVLAEQGQTLGADTGDIVIIPVASAQSLFNAYSLFRILVEARDGASIPGAKRDILQIIRDRHSGEDDVTVISQDALLTTFNRIFTVLTLAVAAIGAISLLVAGILIMNVMLISVSQRTSEIGLLAALGAPPRQILLLFLIEAGLLSLLGALLGIAAGYGLKLIANYFFPGFPLIIPGWAVAAALAVALGTGIGFGSHPASQAARLNPVLALSGPKT